MFFYFWYRGWSCDLFGVVEWGSSLGYEEYVFFDNRFRLIIWVTRGFWFGYFFVYGDSWLITECVGGVMLDYLVFCFSVR